MQELKTCIVVGICPSHWSIFAFYPSACRRKANKSLRLPFFATDCGQNSTNCKVLLHAFRRLWLPSDESRCLLLHFLLNGSSLREIIAHGADLEMLWPSCRHLTLSGLQSNLLRTNETIFPLCNGWGTIAHIGDWNVRFLISWFANDDDDDESFLLRRLHIDCIPIVYCHPLGDCNCHLPDTNIQYNSVNATSRNNFIIKVNSQNTVKWHITYIVDTSRPYGRSICTGLNYAAPCGTPSPVWSDSWVLTRGGGGSVYSCGTAWPWLCVYCLLDPIKLGITSLHKLLNGPTYVHIYNCYNFNDL